MNRPTENWKVGLFVVGVLTAGVLGLAALGARGLSRPTVGLVAFFDESTEGLSVGTPVKFRGVTVGEVARISFAPDRRHVQVDIDAYTDVLRGLGLEEDATVMNASLEIEDAGIRLRIVRSALTGFTYLEADVFDQDARPAQVLPFDKPFNYVPTEPSTLKSLEDDLSATLAGLPSLIRDARRVVNELSAALDDLALAETSARLSAVLARAESALGALDVKGLNALVEELRAVAGAIDREALARASGSVDDLVQGAADAVERIDRETERLGEALEASTQAARTLSEGVAAAELGETAAALRRAAAALELLGGEGTRASERAGPALRELERALAALAALADRLERDPSSILFGTGAQR